MSKVTLIRPDESVNTSYAYPILVNNKTTTTLENNSRETFTIDDDQAVIQAKSSWGGSKKESFDLKNQDHLTLRVEANIFYSRVIRYTGAVAFPSLAAVWILADSPFFRYSILIFGLVSLLYLIYTLTIDKDNWLLINKVEA